MSFDFALFSRNFQNGLWINLKITPSNQFYWEKKLNVLHVNLVQILYHLNNILHYQNINEMSVQLFCSLSKSVCVKSFKIQFARLFEMHF